VEDFLLPATGIKQAPLGGYADAQQQQQQQQQEGEGVDQVCGTFVSKFVSHARAPSFCSSHTSTHTHTHTHAHAHTHTYIYIYIYIYIYTCVHAQAHAQTQHRHTHIHTQHIHAQGIERAHMHLPHFPNLVVLPFAHRGAIREYAKAAQVTDARFRSVFWGQYFKKLQLHR